MKYQAIILAAGIGKRLSGIVNQPKCLMRFGQESLLERHIRLLRHHDIEDILIVVGYLAPSIIDHINTRYHNIQFVENPHFREGSMISLYHGLQQANTADAFILMDADVLYEEQLLHRLVDTKHDDCLLLDRSASLDSEAVKVGVDHRGNVSLFGKHVEVEGRFPITGESVGFFRLRATVAERLYHGADDYIQEQRRHCAYEDLLSELIQNPEFKFAYEDITGLAWTEIDFPHDLDHANTHIMPRILKSESQKSS